LTVPFAALARRRKRPPPGRQAGSFLLERDAVEEQLDLLGAAVKRCSKALKGDQRRLLMSAGIAKPWALMRHHAGWADIFRVESETAEGLTGCYPDRESDEQVTYTAFAVLARFSTLEAARAARERGLAERRKHDDAVEQAQSALKAAEKVREDAWVAGLQAADAH
jgi:hypothetical protein